MAIHTPASVPTRPAERSLPSVRRRARNLRDRRPRGCLQHVGPIYDSDIPAILEALEKARWSVRHLPCAVPGRTRSRSLSLPPAYWAYRQLPDPKQEAKAQALMEELRCLVCQGRWIAISMLSSRVTCATSSGGVSPRARSRGNPCLAHRTLRRLDQLPTLRRTGCMAALGNADCASDFRRCDGCWPSQKEARVTGWTVLVAIVALTIGSLLALRVRGAMLQLSAAAILFGAAGYAVQGQPGLAGSPRSADQRPAPIPLTNLRHGLLRHVGPPSTGL